MFRRITPTRSLGKCFAALLVVACSAWFAHAEDVVNLTSEGGHGRVTIRGEIINYTGKTITITCAGGPPIHYPAARVVDIQTVWTAGHDAGRAAISRREFDAAARHLADANRAETRVWVRRLILTDWMLCYDALGQPERAGDLFVVLAESDPATPAYAAAPLAWFSDDRVRRVKAESWLGRHEQPAAVLLGSSYLLSTTAAAIARPSLTELTNHPDPRIAALAEAQLWRLDLSVATRRDVERWDERIGQMPQDVRAGPYFVLGQAYARLGMSDRSALAYLRVPILFDGRRELAARALVESGRVVGQAGHRDEAAWLLSEVTSWYQQTPQASEAHQLLNR